MAVTVPHVCTRDGHWRAGAYCGSCHAPCTTPTRADCGDEVSTRSHECA